MVRKILTKCSAVTDAAIGCCPEERKTEDVVSYGIINLNKPKGPTSHQVSEHVKHIFQTDRAGHSGTLDPAVTGVLPVAIGKATRVVQALLIAGKEYVGVMHLHQDVTPEAVAKMVPSFVGKIMQLPPVKSAVARRLRVREIYAFDILEQADRDVLFRVECQAGTYIRKLVHDFGRTLGCGAHMSQLVRTRAGPFFEKDMVTLQDLEDALVFWKEQNDDTFLRHCVLPVEAGVAHLPKVWVQDSAVDSLTHGAMLHIPGVVKLHEGIQPNEMVAVMTLKDELVALGTSMSSSEDILAKEKGAAVKPDKVFFEQGIYKKLAATSPKS